MARSCSPEVVWMAVIFTLRAVIPFLKARMELVIATLAGVPVACFETARNILSWLNWMLSILKKVLSSEYYVLQRRIRPLADIKIIRGAKIGFLGLGNFYLFYRIANPAELDVNVEQLVEVQC